MSVLASRGAARRRRPLPWLAAAALYTGLTLVYARTLLPVLTSHLPFDTGDPALNTWILWWNAQVVPVTERWWNAPIFVPVTGALALSESLLALAPLTTPLQWLGGGPVLAYNLAFLASYPAAALAAHALAHRLTGRHDAALLAGLAYGFSPYRAAHLPHLQMLWSCWMPLALLALHRYLDVRQVRYLLVAAACWVLNGLTSGYYLMHFSVFLGLWILWFARSWRSWVSILGAFALGGVVLAPVLLGYWRHQQDLGVARSIGEIVEFSADASAIFAASRAGAAGRWTLAPRSEGELYPGAAVLALSLVAAWLAWRAAGRARWARWRLIVVVLGAYLAEAVLLTMWLGPWSATILGQHLSMTRPGKPLFLAVCLLSIALAADPRLRDAWRRRSVLLFYAAAAVAMFVLALGPTGRAFGEVFWPRAPYVWLMDLLPGGRALRVPARFAMLLMLCLSITASIASARLTRDSLRRGLLIALLSAAVVLDGWVPRLPTAAAAAPLELPPDAPEPAAVLELPVQDSFGETAAMLRATGHRRPLVNGFSGYAPPHYFPLRAALAAHDPLALDAIRQFQPLVVVINAAADPAGDALAFVQAQPDAVRLGDTAIGPAFGLPVHQLPEPEGAAIAVASVTASKNRELAGLMTDGRLDTRWRSGRPAEGARLDVALDAVRPLARVELALGPFTYDFPRDLEVSVNEGDRETAIWRGDTAAAAAVGILADRRQAALSIPLPESAVGNRITLRLRSVEATEEWSVAELRVFAR